VPGPKEEIVADKDDGVPVENLIADIKDALALGGLSPADNGNLRLVSVQLILEVVATASGKVGLDFRVPFIGTKLSMSAKRVKRDTHTVDIMLVPADRPPATPVRADNMQRALVGAIRTIREMVASAGQGDDPWDLSSGTIDISFAVTRGGIISLGIEGELENELTQILRIRLARA
jgi:hypothetical protein